MTQEDINAWQERKAAAVEELTTLCDTMSEHTRTLILDTDERLMQYIENNRHNPASHNLFEILAVSRFIKLFDKYEWQANRVKNFYSFYEKIKFSGVDGRQRYKLTPVQCFQFANIFGFAREDGRRLTRSVYIFVPRKFSKTTSAAALAIYDMLTGDNNAQAYVGANSYDQAKICFDEIRHIMLGLDPSGRTFKVNREKITFRENGRDSLIQCLSANASTKDGLFASLIIMDEYAQARNTSTKNGADLKNVLTTSMGPRRQPLTVVISTASEVVDGPFYNELNGVKKILLGEVENDQVFASIFAPDAGDDEGDPNTWAKVQPHLGVTVQPDYYADQWREAQLSKENLLSFRTKLLNVFAKNEQRAWINSTVARDISEDFTIESIKGRPDAMVAIDLSESDDFSAVTIGMYEPSRKGFRFHTSYFFPEGALKGHPNERMYRKWAEEGHLKLTSGEVIDYREIVSYILDMNKYTLQLCIGYDPWKSQEFINMLSAAGASDVIKGIKQTYGTFTAPVESFEHGVKTGKIIINANPINYYCFGNAVLDYDTLENCKPIKKSHNQKIDGVITTLMCVRMFMDYSG